jgi:predicted branched-subunit amino acid permease
MPTSRNLVLRGVRDAMAFPAWVVGFSLLGVGSLVRDVGHPVGAAILSTLLIWAGPGQVILYGGLAAGSAPLVIALAVSLSSMRFLPMTMTVLPLLREPARGLATRLLVAHCISVTVWVESARRLPSLKPEERLPYYLGFANTCLWFSAFMTAIGYFLVGSLPLPLGAALLFLTPIFFTISLVAGAKTSAEWSSIALGFGLAPIFTWIGAEEFGLLGTGLVGGTAAHLIGRARSRPKQ